MAEAATDELVERLGPFAEPEVFLASNPQPSPYYVYPETMYPPGQSRSQATREPETFAQCFLGVKPEKDED